MRDTQLFCEIVGDGPLLLALHGGLGLDHRYLRPWLDPLAESARVAFFDLRGHGRSQGRETLAHADHGTLCADTESLREQLGAEQVFVFGHSYGGFLALEYALRYPNRVAGLVLCATAASTAHIPAALELAPSRGVPDALSALRGALAQPARSDKEFADSWSAVLPLYFHGNDPRRSAAMFADTVFSSEGYNQAFFKWLPTYDVRDRLGGIDAPALVLSGADDWIMSPRLAGDELAARLSRSDHVVFEQSGHFPFVEESQLFADTVSRWLRRMA